MTTKIEWCDETWNPVRTAAGGWHCTKISPGCDHCWSESINLRFGDKSRYDRRTGDYVISESTLHQVFHWKKPRRIFVQDMGDLGLIWESHPDVFKRVLSVVGQSMGYKQGHTFIFLTKRPSQLFEGMSAFKGSLMMQSLFLEIGVTTEDQKRADERIPELFRFRDIAPRAKLFICAEPLLGPLDLTNIEVPPDSDLLNHSTFYPSRFNCLTTEYDDVHFHQPPVSLHGVILGGETGKKARLLEPGWVRMVRNACNVWGIPFFFKSWGETVPSISDSIGDERAGQLPPLGILTGDFRRYLDGRTWDQLPGKGV